MVHIAFTIIDVAFTMVHIAFTIIDVTFTIIDVAFTIIHVVIARRIVSVFVTVNIIMSTIIVPIREFHDAHAIQAGEDTSIHMVDPLVGGLEKDVSASDALFAEHEVRAVVIHVLLAHLTSAGTAHHVQVLARFH